MAERNLQLPGNPRYQPKELVPYFGYDNLYSAGLAQVEIANLEVLAEIGVMPPGDAELLTAYARAQLLGITTTEVDEYERHVTKHDVRAWVELAKQQVPAELGRWIHVPLTSYDALDTGRILLYVDSYEEQTRPRLEKAISQLAERVEASADDLQIGRTHGQHALPITVGFWLATVLDRWVYNYQQMERCHAALVGKISGAVGAHNAIVGLGFADRCLLGETYEGRVLRKLGLAKARISSQILSPEPLAYFLHSAVMMSSAIGQFGRDCRQLARSEIGEVTEPFSAKQTGSSTMAHKRNPINFEGLEGQAVKNVAELGKIMTTLISEHQRDLVGSCVMRDFPVVLVNLHTQLGTLLRRDSETDRSFLERFSINVQACWSNFKLSSGVVLAEPMYIALQMAGYEGDAHDLVNHVLTPNALESGATLFSELLKATELSTALYEAVNRIPNDILTLLSQPDRYTGDASQQAKHMASRAREAIRA